MKTILRSSFVSLRRRMLLVAALASVGLSITLPTPALAQVYTGDLVLTTQAEVDAFHYTEVTGNLGIRNPFPGLSDIRNLNGLSMLEAVGGSLEIRGMMYLQNVDGLSSLRSVGGDLQCNFDESLANVDGLSALTSIGGKLQFFHNNSLTNLYGLSSLTTLGGSLIFIDTLNVRGRFSLTEIGGDLSVDEGQIDSLDGLFPKLTTIGRHLAIHHCPLTNLDGLATLNSIGGTLGISGVKGLQNIDGLSSLKTVGALQIAGNSALPNLNGLSSLTSIGGFSFISENDSLENINGLSSLSSVGDDLNIAANRQLTEFCGLWRLVSAGHVVGRLRILLNAANPTVEEIIAAGPCDSDGDGVPDDQDSCASSDLRPTVSVLNCDSGVPNPVDGNGCSVADRVASIVAQAAIGAKNHGQFVSRTTKELNVFVTNGLITQSEQQALMGCVGSSQLP